MCVDFKGLPNGINFILIALAIINDLSIISMQNTVIHMQKVATREFATTDIYEQVWENQYKNLNPFYC